jgi:alpha-glucosidase
MFETLGLCGESFVGADCGGFIGKSNGELLTRWYQIGFLSPFFRNHHTKDDNYQEPWRFGKQYEDIIRKYVQLRYRLLPYLYTVLAEAHETGVPWIRPLVLENQDDRNVFDIDDEFMVGSALLCAPVLQEGATSRDVYLPEGEWFNFFTNKKYKGGKRVTVEAPLDTVPLFVKAGSVLPTGPILDYVGQQSDKKITYEVFPNNEGVATGQLYEDDGTTQAYLHGSCDHLTLEFKNGRLTSTSAKGEAEITPTTETITVHNPS